MIDAFGTHRRESSAPWACAVRRRLRRFRCARAMRGDDDARDGLFERIARGELNFVWIAFDHRGAEARVKDRGRRETRCARVG